MIYDRTQADVDEAMRLLAKMQAGEALTDEESAAYYAGLRGHYNLSDLNRVEAAVAKLAELLRGYGYAVSVEVKTDWAVGDVMRYDDIVRYLANVAAIRNAFPASADTPDAVTIDRWINFAAANDIERLLYEVEQTVNGAAGIFRRCGTFSAGQYRKRYVRKNVSEDTSIEVIDLGDTLVINSPQITAWEDGDTLYITAPEGLIGLE